jgi:hypothetical protein
MTYLMLQESLCDRRKDSQEAWPMPEGLAKKASAVQTHSSVRTEHRTRVRRTTPWWFSADYPPFFEAEITWPTVKRLTDNNVIEHVDLQDPGSLGQPASQADISIARCRITVWMVVLCGV